MITASSNATDAPTRTRSSTRPPGGDLARVDRTASDGHMDGSTAQFREAEAAAQKIATAMVEVLTGERAAIQLKHMVTPAVLAQVSRAVAASRPGSSRLRHRIHRIHVSHPANGVVEVCAVLRNSARASALALRLELLDGRWRCTAVETDQHRRPPRARTS